jgi:phospholipid/cholesterol/gamma-HCH transport system ATP-binding protein
MGLKQRLNITSIVVTHDMKSAFTISDRVAMVYGGRVICVGTVDEFRNAPDERVRNFVEGRAPMREDVATLLSA